MCTVAIVLALCSTPLYVKLPLYAGSAEVLSQRMYSILNKEEVQPCKAGIFRVWRMKIINGSCLAGEYYSLIIQKMGEKENLLLSGNTTQKCVKIIHR